MAINNSVGLAPWADALYACDLMWWNSYPELHEKFAGDKWSMDPEAHRFGAMFVRAVVGGGLSEIPGVIRHGQNSGHQAIALSAQWGARTIILLGFDCGQGDKAQRHWHADHPPRCGNPGSGEFSTWAQHHRQMAGDARAAGIRIFNASRATQLVCYDRVDLEEALREIDF